MKLIRLALPGVALVLSAIACNTPQSEIANNAPAASPATKAATPDEFAAARTIFLRECVACHGEKGEGGVVKIEDKKLKVPSYKEGHALMHPDSQFIDQISKGGDGMPAFKDKLKPEEMNALVRFIRHEFQGGMTPPTEPMKPMKH
jgi:mono/diheme cytochrome c family protein